MALGVSHRPDYHEWAKSTPVIDAIGSVVAVASVLIGGYAGLFLILAAEAGRWDTVVDCARFFVYIAVGNAAFEFTRHWHRHHG